VTASLSSRSPASMLALAFLTATIVVLLVLSPQAVAQARKAACPSSVAAHPKRETRACAQARHTSKPSHKSGAHRRSKVKGHHSRHAGAKKGAAKMKAAKKRDRSPARGQTRAVCENGSAPVQASDGSFSCADESEPACPNGSTPVLSSNGSTLLCDTKASGSGSSEAVCEDGSAPVRASDGSFSCDDESEPVCENGSVPTLSSDGSTLLCGAESSDLTSTEVLCEDGSAAVQAGDGSFSCDGSSEPSCENSPVPTLSSGHWTPLCNVTVGNNGAA
jgi:hypothetical protein